jgi:hypothetical protein
MAIDVTKSTAAFERDLRKQLRDDHARAMALRLRLNATDCAEIAAGLAKHPQFDLLRERIMEWATAMLGGERTILDLLPVGPRPTEPEGDGRSDG